MENQLHCKASNQSHSKATVNVDLIFGLSDVSQAK